MDGHESLAEEVKRTLESMSATERDRLRRRFGIEMLYNPTPEQAEKQFQRQRARIRQIEQEALKKLRDGDAG